MPAILVREIHSVRFDVAVEEMRSIKDYFAATAAEDPTTTTTDNRLLKDVFPHVCWRRGLARMLPGIDDQMNTFSGARVAPGERSDGGDGSTHKTPMNRGEEPSS